MQPQPNLEYTKIVVANKFNISQREFELLEEMITGKTNQEIADTLFITDNTVKFHFTRIYEKLGVTSRGKAWRKYVDFKNDLLYEIQKSEEFLDLP